MCTTARLKDGSGASEIRSRNKKIKIKKNVHSDTDAEKMMMRTMIHLQQQTSSASVLISQRCLRHWRWFFFVFLFYFYFDLQFCVPVVGLQIVFISTSCRLSACLLACLPRSPIADLNDVDSRSCRLRAVAVMLGASPWRAGQQST